MANFIDTKNRFHVALDGQGLLLQGAPDRPGYAMSQAPIYAQRFGVGNRDYTDFSFWWFWAQTDWSGGYKLEDRWKDDAKFSDSEGISISIFPGIPGNVSLNMRAIRTVNVPNINMRWRTFGDTWGLFLLMGRNETHSRMRAVNSHDGTTLWEDPATVNFQDILSADRISNDIFIGCREVGSGTSKLKRSSSGPFIDVGAHSSGGGLWRVIAYPTLNSLFLFKDIDGVWQYNDTPTPGVFTQRQTALPMNITSIFNFSLITPFGAALVRHRIFFTFNGTSSTDMQLWAFDITNNIYVHVYTFRGGTFSEYPLLVEKNNNLYIIGTTGGLARGRILIYKLDANLNLTLIHTIGRAHETGFRLVGGVVNISNSICFGVDDMRNNFQIWQLDKRDALFSGIRPPLAFSTRMDLLAINGEGNLFICNGGLDNRIDSFVTHPTQSFQTFGFITTSNFDGDIPSIDKLFFAITISFRRFLLAQSIEVQYSIDGGVTPFISLGVASFSLDGGNVTSKTLFFGRTIVSKTMKLRFILNGGGGDTPILEAFACQYVPVPVYTKQWVLQVNCADELKRLDGALVETTARELKSRLEIAWWTKALLTFQDLDYATTLLNGALTNLATTITVHSTHDFPEQGRLRVGNEEMFYTNKTPTTFTGVTRGVRGTVAIPHPNNTVVNNAYNVIITDLQVRTPVLLEDKNLEYIVTLNLREA